MYKLRISLQAQKELKKINKLHRQLVISALEDIKENPFQGKLLKRELSGKVAYRIGVYRIIYKIDASDKIINIITAGHRSVVYKN